MSSAFYQPHLDRVSRSFAFCIAELPEPLKERVGLSYLLCRLLDTVEDAPWDNVADQQQAFADFDQAVLSLAHVDALRDWTKQFPPSITAGEKILLEVAPRLLADLHALPAAPRQILSDLIGTMSRGMQHFCRTRGGGDLRLKSLSDVNQYCFFVAGVVGELLVQLVAIDNPGFTVDAKRALEAHHFGQFLQKVNLLKDQITDEQSGRHLIPSRLVVEGAARRDVGRAFAFLTGLPNTLIEFRRFCAWSLFLGLESLRVARESVGAGRVLKVGRGQLAQIIGEIEIALNDPAELQNLFNKHCQALNWTMDSVKDKPANESSAAAGLPAWFGGAYRGLLRPFELAQLELSAEIDNRFHLE